MPKPIDENHRYIPGLDGLRAIAVLAVIAYHLNLAFLPGGLLGVGVFFVLSGYLITDILIRDWQTSKQLKLGTFWARRARRLLPGMLLMVVMVLLITPKVQPSQWSTLPGDALSSVLYFSNWWFIFHKVSYFHQFGLPSPLNHLWSLAVEEQFYIIWPLMLWFILRWFPRRWQSTLVTLSVAAVSAAVMALLFQPGVDPSRVYYGTDTRAFSMLIGAALAFCWPSSKFQRTSARGWPILILNLIGITSLGAIVAMFVLTNEYQPFLYRGGMVLLSVAAACLIAVLVHPSTWLSRWMGVAPFRFLGVRSYGIYLWHYPVIILTSSSVDTSGPDAVRMLLQVLASITLATLSWRYLEEPIRRGGLSRLIVRSGAITQHRRGIGIVSLGVLIMVGTFGLGLLRHARSLGAAIDRGNAQNVATKAIQPATSTKTISTHANKTSSTVNSVYGKPEVSSVPQEAGKGVTAIGDSIMVDVTPYLKKALPGIVVNGKIGRQLYQAAAVVQQLKAAHELGQTVIIELGTNGAFTKAQLTSLLQSLGPVHRIVLVNTRVPRPWESTVNKTIAEIAKTYPHVTLVNWYADTVGKNTIFYPDGVHLKPDGSRYLASLLRQAVVRPSSQS